ncbi:MAG TPA: hypothetical protein VEI98_04475 [Xanthobacteraceae bacterium]|nr:hypothetical protein [Xanthobacteraceae bacterium]
MPEESSQRESSIRGERLAALPRRARLVRLAIRFIGVAVVVVAAGLLYRGLRDRFVLPQCDSERAKRTLVDVLKELRLEPVRFEPITTVSSGKTEVVCRALLPLPDGANVAVDYRFYWQGNQVNISYSVARRSN